MTEGIMFSDIKPLEDSTHMKVSFVDINGPLIMLLEGRI